MDQFIDRLAFDKEKLVDIERNTETERNWPPPQTPIQYKKFSVKNNGQEFRGIYPSFNKPGSIELIVDDKRVWSSAIPKSRFVGSLWSSVDYYPDTSAILFGDKKVCVLTAFDFGIFAYLIHTDRDNGEVLVLFLPFENPQKKIP